MNTGWVQDRTDASVWYYTGETKDSSEGGLVKGWATDTRDGKRYYLDPATGIMCYGWKQISGIWYYFGEKQYANATHPYGAMYVNEKTPDGYYVGSNGGWRQNTSNGGNSSKSYYTVTFAMQGHGTQITPLNNVVSGSRISAPTAPTAEGYTFGGWYKEAACTNEWKFDTDTVTANTILYSKWTANKYNVTPQVQGDHGTATVKVGGSEPTSEITQAVKGTNLVFTATPKDDYEFDYWEVVSGGIDIEAAKTTNPIRLTMPGTALTMKAHFKAIIPDTYGIIVEDDGHGTAKAQVGGADVTSAAPGAVVTLVATANDGYAFKEWQIDRGLDSITGNSFTMPSKEVKVKAVFEKEYAVEVEAGGHGTVSADVTKGVSGKEVNLTITPDTDYEVDQITVVRGGVTVESNKFNIGTADVKIRVTFKAIVPSAYGIIVEDDGHGTAKAQVGGADVTSAAPGAVVTLVATANDGYAFKEWKIDRGLEAGAITDNSFTMPSKEVKVKAVFEKEYAVEAEAGGHGTVSADVTKGVSGKEVNLTITPDTDYEVDQITVVRGGVTVESNKFNIGTADVKIRVTFKAIVPSAYGIIVEDDGHGTAKAQVGGADVTSAAPGAVVTLVATANDGYAFKEWQIVRGLDSITGNSFTMPSKEVKVKAVFEKEYAVEAEAGGHGTVSADVTKGVSGKEVNLTITPDAGYEKDQITVVRGGVTVVDNKFKIGTADVKIRVTFKVIVPSAYGIIVEDDGHGTAKARVGGADVTSAAPGAVVTLVATANDGYAFKEWKIDRGLEAGAITDNSFTMPSKEVKVKAIFERVYNITLQTNGHGTVSATVGGQTATTAAANAEVTLTATPAEGYKFKEWKTVSGGVTVTDNKFTMPANNVTVQAVFEAVPETKALSDILPTGFPTSDDAAWVTTDGKKAYKDEDNIKVGNLTLGADTTVTKSGDNYVCKSGDATVTFNVKDRVAESITVTGSSDSNGTYTAPYTVTFDMNGVGDQIAVQNIAPGGKVTRPTDPNDSVHVHTFEGWYKDSGYGTQWDFENDTVSANITIYAKWTRTIKSILDTVNFPSNDGNAWENETNGKCYIKNNDKLRFNVIDKSDDNTSLTAKAIKYNDYYTYGGSLITFNLDSSGKLSSIIWYSQPAYYYGDTLSKYNGTYTAPRLTMGFLKSAPKKAITIGSVIEDFLPQLASPSEAKHEAWRSGDSKWCYVFCDEENDSETSLCFKDSNRFISISMDEPVVEDNDTEVPEEDEIIYKYENDDYVITFYTVGGNLISVEFESKGDVFRYYDGVYIAHETIPEGIEMEGTKEDIESDDGKDIQDEETEKKNAEPESEIPKTAAEVKKEEQSQPLASKEETDQETE